MKNKLLIILFFLLAIESFGQDTIKVEKKLFKINIINPGLTFEKSVSNTNTVSLDGNLSFGGNYSSNNGWQLLVSPLIRSQFRHYYNFDRRNSDNRKTTGNSGNYISICTSYYFKSFNVEAFNVNDGFNLGGTWGLQRTYKSSFNINLNAGLGYNFSQNQQKKIVPLINFTLGWSLFNK